MPLGTIAAITIDCPDPQSLAEFYRQITGFEVVWNDPKNTYLAGSDGVRMGFERVEDYRRPQWPGQDSPQQMHIDFSVADLDEAERQVLALGATKTSVQEGGDRWRTFLDPAGHPFDITVAV